MNEKMQVFLVVIIAVVALLSLVLFINSYFKDTLIGKALAPQSFCGCVDWEKPVCGIDGQTYKNSCFADCLGVTVIYYEGACS